MRSAPCRGIHLTLVCSEKPAAAELVGLAEDRKILRRLAAEDTCPGSAGLLDGNATEGGFGGFLDLLFTLAVAAPVRSREACLHDLPKLIKILRFERVCFTERQRAVKERFLNLDEQLLHRPGNAVLGNEAFPFLARPVAARQHDAALGDVLRPDLHPQRDAAHFPVVKLETGALSFALVHFDANLRLRKLFADFPGGLKDQRLLFVGLEDGHDDHLVRREPWGKDQSLIVAMNHNDGADKACRKAPRRRPAML